MRAFAKNLLHKHFHHHHTHEHDYNAQPGPNITHYEERKVFAHYMVGLTDNQTPEEWAQEIQTAHAASIDGFALNIGPNDPWTLPQLRHAYNTASDVSPEFTLFLSFDMACGEWTTAQVIDLIREFKDHPAQYRRGGQPLVSTFEGPGWAENWDEVRRCVEGGICLVPDWSSLGPWGVGERKRGIEGAFSWGAWPRAGEGRMTADEDCLYRRALGREKVYMMGVSPWFYTRLPQWDKNWHSSGESLWFDRWMQVLEHKPELVQIITWNDFGESSYICDPLRPAQVVPGADLYVDGHSHAAFRATLPYFIKAFKSGMDASTAVPDEDCAIAWYRTTPAGCGSDGGTMWGQGGSHSASHGVRDVVSVLAITRNPTTVQCSIGHHTEELHTHHRHVSFFEVPMHDRTGPVMLEMNGRTTQGPDIRHESHPCGHVMFNCTTIQV